MTWGNPPKLTPTKPKPGKKITPEMLAASGSEDGEQAALFCWATDHVETYPQLKYLFAIPNGGSRHIAEATKMVAGGVRSGVPDLMLPFAVNNSHGCFIELKIEKRRNQIRGGCSEEQIEWITALLALNYHCAVCYSWQDARDVLIKYLEGKL